MDKKTIQKWEEDKSRIKMIEECFGFELSPSHKNLLQTIVDNKLMVCENIEKNENQMVIIAFVVCEMALATKNQKKRFLWVEPDIESVEKTVSDIHDQLKQLPKWFFELNEDIEDVFISGKPAVRFISLDINGEISRIIVKTSAVNTYKCLMCNYLIINQSEIIDNGEETYSGALATHDGIKTINDEKIYPVLIITTPNGRKNYFKNLGEKTKFLCWHNEVSRT